MPWKNGGGQTLELAVEPPGATLETGFRWRISSAEVGVSGPFSAFPGLERWLLLLEGNGFEIDFGARGRAVLDEPLVPVRFPGDWPATATLLGGPCTDLNLMIDRGFRAGVEILRQSASRNLALQSATTLLFVAQGTASVPALGLELGRRHLLRIDGAGEGLCVAPGVCGATLVRMDLDPA